MGGRGRGRGRGFGRGNPFPGVEQMNLNPAEKMSVVPIASTPYPALDHYPAPLADNKEYDELIDIKNRLSSYFQTSRFNLKINDENSKLFTSQGEVTVEKKTSLNFNWDYFPLELRPTNKRMKDKNELLADFRKSKLSAINLSLLDKLEEKEKNDVLDADIQPKEEEGIKKETEELPEDEENDEFDDDELDDGNDYNINYFDDGGGYLDEDDDMDEGPCY